MLKYFFLIGLLLFIASFQVFGINPWFSFWSPSLVLMFILALVWSFEWKTVFWLIVFLGIVLDQLTFLKIGSFLILFLFLGYFFYWLKQKVFWNQSRGNDFLIFISINFIYIIFILFKEGLFFENNFKIDIIINIWKNNFSFLKMIFIFLINALLFFSFIKIIKKISFNFFLKNKL